MITEDTKKKIMKKLDKKIKEKKAVEVRTPVKVTAVTVTEKDLLREEEGDLLGEATKAIYLRFIGGQWECEMIGDGWKDTGEGEEVDPSRVVLPADIRIAGRVLAVAHKYYRRGITMGTVMKEREKSRKQREQEKENRKFPARRVSKPAPYPPPPQGSPSGEVLSEMDAVSKGVAASLLGSVS